MSTSIANIRRATFSLVFITLAYVAVLVVIDIRKNIFHELLTLSSVLPVAMVISLLSYIIRYCRWHWLLKRSGNPVPAGSGFLAYLSGFALTATPGKIGELLRIRYFSRLGVRHQRTISAFIYERAFDLLAVLAIALLAAFQLGAFKLIFTFVLLVTTAVILFARNPSWLTFMAVRLRTYRLHKLSMLVKTLRDSFHGIHHWLNPLDMSISFVSGLIAWLLASSAFVLLIFHLDIDIPLLSAIAIYPIAMLIGAASMLPGGIGSTEASIVGLLVLLDSPVTIASVAAIGIRISSIWFSVVCGLVSMLILEYTYTNDSSR